MLKTYSDSDDRFQLELQDQISLELAGYVNCPPGWKGTEHAHPFWELIYFHQGGGTMKFREREYPCSTNNLFLMPPNEKHLFNNNSSNLVENLYLGFSFQFNPSMEIKTEREILLATQPQVDVLKGGLKELLEAFKLSKEGKLAAENRLQIFEIVFRVVDFISVDNLTSQDYGEKRNLIVTNKAKQYLEANIHRQVTVQEVSEQIYLSPQYFGIIFKQTTGMGVKQYHNNLRMFKAKKLLKESAFSITEIAYQLGFENIHYFSRKFKDYFNVAPTSFRQQN